MIQRIAIKGFQSYRELRETLLRQYTREHSWNLMKKLVRLELLSECPSDNGGILGWVLAKGIRKEYLPQGSPEWVQGSRPPRYSTSFSHDLLVRQIEDLLCKAPGITNWIPEHALRKEILTRFQYLGESKKSEHLAKVPDARFDLQISENLYKAALELELTRKSKKRVYDRIEAHVINEDLDFIFFVVSDENHLEFLWSIYEEVLARSYRVKLHSVRNGIYFTTLRNLRRHGRHANFRGIAETFCFEPKAL